MERPSYIPPDFPADAFAGTAHYYARYRLPYPSALIGHLYSTSLCSKRLLGKNVAAFEQDLEQALLKCDPSGRYHQDVDCGYTLGRKPAGAPMAVGA